MRRVSPEKSAGSLQVKYGNKNEDTTVYGAGPDFGLIHHLDFKEGRFFTDKEDQSRATVCVLGWNVYKDLFDRGSCVGRRIYIKGANYTIVGLIVQRGGTGFMNEDDRIYVPVRSAMQRLSGSENVLSSISVEGRSQSLMQKAQDEIGDVLRKRHKLGTGKADDFIIFNAGTAMQNSDAQAADFEQLINCLAAVALVVGGIGIMNIMLVSVTERTREIGVRKAIGAKRSNILSQFLLEALFLSLTGGLIGVVFGILFTLYGLPKVKPDWETSLTLEPTFVAFGFSALVGIFFGFYPALKASKLNPIEALRYE